MPTSRRRLGRTTACASLLARQAQSGQVRAQDAGQPRPPIWPRWWSAGGGGCALQVQRQQPRQYRVLIHRRRVRIVPPISRPDLPVQRRLDVGKNGLAPLADAGTCNDHNVRSLGLGESTGNLQSVSTLANAGTGIAQGHLAKEVAMEGERHVDTPELAQLSPA